MGACELSINRGPARSGAALCVLMATLLAAGLAVLPAQSIAAQPVAAQPAAKPLSLETIYRSLHARRFVDLTHDFGPGIPHWQGFEDERAPTIYTYEKDGFWAQEFSHPGQWGTHIDPPAHFVKGLRTVDQIRPDEMFLQLVVLDIHKQVEKNPDYVVTMADVRAWERRHGPIPKDAFVALRTDWSKRWPSDAAMHNADAAGVYHYPGWSKPVLQYLYETRKITASGHETTDTDPGIPATKGDFSLEAYLLGTNHYQIEMLTNLDQVPESGALVMVTFPKPKGGSGFPARVIAILP
jgi:kynurenine formamidase